MEQQPLHQHQSTAQQQSRSLKNNSAMVTEELYVNAINIVNLKYLMDILLHKERNKFH